MPAPGGHAELNTLLPRLEHAASGRGGVTFIGQGGAERASWRELHDDARAVAATLQARDAGPGAHVALLGPTSRELVTAVQAVWLTGATVVVLPLPMRLASLETFVEQTRARIRQADARLVVVDPALSEFVVGEEGDPAVLPLDALVKGATTSDAYDPPEVDPSSLAILQYTSGSTSDPKGVMMRHSAVCANLDDIVAASRFTPDDVVVSWLPLYHDMGLIGLLGTPMTTGAELVLASPDEFLRRPANWTEWLAEYRGTVTGGPNFGYAVSARALRRRGDLDLSSLRLAMYGSEPIDPETAEAWTSAGEPNRLDPRVVFPAYGLAEATLAVTFPEPGTGLRLDVVDSRALEHEGAAVPSPAGREGSRRLPRVGRPLRLVELRIVHPASGDPLPERCVGEITIAGPAVTAGYYRRPDVTNEAIRGQWLHTGDLGYLVDDELVVCGRIKDVIIVGGRNVYPQEIEWAVGTVDGVRAGNVVAFGVTDARGHERVVVAAESRSSDPAAARRDVAGRVRAAVGLPPADVVLLEPGALPKTSSGKLQRSLTRSRYLAGDLAQPATRLSTNR